MPLSQPPPDPNWEFLKLLLYSLVAGLGGILGHLMREMDGERTPRVFATLLQGISAAFVGGLVYLMCQAFQLNDQWTGVIVGVCGWLGANASIQLVERFVFQKLGVSKKDVCDVPNDIDKG